MKEKKTGKIKWIENWFRISRGNVHLPTELTSKARETRLIKRICQEMHLELTINLWKLALHLSPNQPISIVSLQQRLKDLKSICEKEIWFNIKHPWKVSSRKTSFSAEWKTFKLLQWMHIFSYYLSSLWLLKVSSFLIIFISRFSRNVMRKVSVWRTNKKLISKS